MNQKSTRSQAKSHYLGNLIGRLTAPALKRRGFRDVQIMDHWPVIVGRQLATLTMPERLVRRSEQETVLVVRVDGAMALEIQHLSPQILDRINQYYGPATVTRLQIIQGPLPHAFHGVYPRPAELRPLTQQADEALADFPRGSLRDALARLGGRIMHRASKTGEN
jgi:hypothetical protein